MMRPAEFPSPCLADRNSGREFVDGGGTNGYGFTSLHSIQAKRRISGITLLAAVATLLIRYLFDTF